MARHPHCDGHELRRPYRKYEKSIRALTLIKEPEFRFIGVLYESAQPGGCSGIPAAAEALSSSEKRI
jgi:hypothetical protein